ncbi:unnamed protein product [Triticum turgidum subsp. durum]|uniref:Protein kinase domain-containing protein n=1 Tax=Triticum turgidum subsp. durum TaxID=4567 RepID=A0A9R1R3J7_TRITD|nr:unnamed protein product [Triticum turgidum subsp. durum]
MFLGELQLRHPCLVRMIGYCCEEEHRLLVYELMAHGSLDDYFFKRPVLPWSTRLSIVLAKRPSVPPRRGEAIDLRRIQLLRHPTCLDIRVVLSLSTRLSIALATAKGLLSLHGEEKPLISSKFNASNILLDSYNNVKLSDLWFARKYGKGDDSNEYTLMTSGYGCPPEYVMSGDFTMKCDVYCFGVVLLEILTRQRLDWVTRASEQNLQNLRPRLRDPLELGRVMDPVLKDIYPVAAAHEACMVAYRCLHASPEKRLSMLAVVEALDLLVRATTTDEVNVGQTNTRT